MTTDNVIEVRFGNSTLVSISPKYRYDSGWIMKFVDLDLPESYQVHFGNTLDGDTIEAIGDSNGVEIPDILWENGEIIYCWLYLHPTEDSSITKKEVRIAVGNRGKLPTGVTPEPHEQTIIDQLITAMNRSADKAEQNAQEAESSADRSEASATLAEGYLASVQSDAEIARTKAQEAESSAVEAEQSETSAQNYAQMSANSASEAQGYAEDLAESVAEAKGYSESAGISAHNAEVYADQAEIAKTEAISGKEAIISAKDEAVLAKNEAVIAKNEAVLAKTDAESAKTASQTAHGLAEDARDSAISAKNDAVAAKAAAQTAQTGAETARDAVQSSAAQIATNASDITALKEDLSELKDATTVDVAEWNPVTLELQNGYWWYKNGQFTTDNARKSAKITVAVGDTYKLSTFTRPATISGLIYFDANDAVISHALDGTGTETTITDYEFTIPDGVSSIAVQSADSSKPPTLINKSKFLEFAGYTKAETDAKLALNGYGVCWSISDPDDLGQRVGKAIGMTAVIGEGSTNGYSDFDTIYPWSEMKRCNIKVNANGATVVTYEGETGFALDGTNGNVFVRIPKFNVLRYTENGYEYRVIGVPGSPTHEAFIENGKELDEIFVGAFEGYISNGVLKSIGGVIPTSNETPQTFLDDAKANGSNYSLYDNRCVDAIWTLMAVEFGCRNSNQILGYGLANFMQPTTYYSYQKALNTATATNTVRTEKWTDAKKAYMPVGSNITVCKGDQRYILTQAKITACVDGTDYTDWTFDGNPIDVDTDCFIGSGAFNTNWCDNSATGALTWHTGRNNWIDGSNTKNAVRYRWIENVVGNLWHYLPDVTFNNLQMYVCKNMSDYEFFKKTGEYKPVGDLLTQNDDNGNKADVVGANYWIASLLNDTFAKAIPFGKAFDLQLTSKKAFGGFYYLSSGTQIIANGGGFDHLYRCNMLTQRAWINPSDKWYLYGARLMYKHLT